MTSAALSLIPYALVAAASPLGLAATLTVLRTGRLQALGLAAGVLVGQLAACGVLVLIGTASVGHRTKRPNVEGVLELLLGVALLALALQVHRRRTRPRRDTGRSQQILGRLQRVRTSTDVVAGLALGTVTALGVCGIAFALADGPGRAALDRATTRHRLLAVMTHRRGSPGAALRAA